MHQVDFGLLDAITKTTVGCHDYRPPRILVDIAEITLSDGSICAIDVEDLWIVAGRNWTASRDHSSERVYASSRIDGRYVYLHRLLANAPDGFMVDHIDRNTLNCRRSNLRVADAKQNARNRGVQSNNKSGFKGVSYHKSAGKWRAMIYVGKQRHHLGHFDTPEAASAAYRAAAPQMFGDFAAQAPDKRP